jgi:HSP20 family protein
MALLPSRRKEGERPIVSLQREMNRLFDDFFGRDFFVEPFRGMGEWRPAMDVAETDNAVLVKTELPGLDAKDVEISLSGDVLTIKGEKKEEKEEKTKSFHRVERHYGSFERAIRLPASVKADKVEATFKNGVLTIELPKTEESKAKSVKIKVE